MTAAQPVILLGVEEGRARTVLLSDGRDPDRYLRVTWHPDTETVVFSHWHGAVCSASSSVPLSEAARLADLLATAVRQSAGGRDEDTVVMRMPTRSAAVGRTGGPSRSRAHEGGE